MSDRKELINSAVEFLQNPQIDSAPLDKKIEFLKSKGLTDAEINDAISSGSKPVNSSDGNFGFNNDQYFNVAAAQPPPLPERDWKDYFIMATSTVSIGYGLYFLFKNVVIPTVMPQSHDQLEADREAINNEFQRVQGLLDSLEQHNKTLVDNDIRNSEKLETLVAKVNRLVLNSENSLSKNSDDLKLIKLEIDNLKTNYKFQNTSIENIIDNKLTNINTELESLKKLLSTRISENGDSKKDSKKSISVSEIPSAADILKKLQPKANGAEKKQDTPEVDRSEVPAWQLTSD